MGKRIVVVGGGAAGIGAAGAVKATDKSADVVVYTEYEDAAYSPCGIPYVHGKEISDFQSLFLATKESYRESGIDIHYETAVTGLRQAGRQFDYVMDDVSYADEPEVALPKLLAVVPLVTPRGSLVVNRHRRGDPRPLARTLRLYFREVRLRRVRRTGENTLICCSRPLVNRAGGV